ncbi:hypothetical protein Q7C36_016679 [Tachysurus vachellii]|uniref:Uncharacterized protein n=1 Tax=Tachysurus vachellii TaxID=175792 RepID=A0AA88M8U7_TACVA|nr:uncharacterized protein LOC132858135 [Tachysurus vachellii]KAK2831593.1 hypothetical protein Q7C36_016679 [Tachysurus vachellii]
MNVLIIIVLLFPLNAKGTTKSIPTTSQGPSVKENTNAYHQKTVTDSSSTKTSFNKPGDLKNASNSTNKTETTVALNKCGHGTGSSVKDKQFRFFQDLDLKTFLTFLSGVICSTLIFSTVLFFVAICNRCRAKDANKNKESIALKDVKHEDELLVMQTEEDKVDDKDPLQVQTPADVSTKTSGTEEERKLLGKEHTEGARVVSEVDYASINYSLLQKKKDGDLNPKQAESDYAEIQIKKPNEGEEVQTVQHGLEKDEVVQEGAMQDGGDQGIEDGMESEKQAELEEVQV